jgi:hypothetical protein
MSLRNAVLIMELGLCSYSAYLFFSKSSMENIDILTPQVKIIDSYSGSAPKEELDNLLDRIDIVKADNPTNTSEIIKLEDAVYNAKMEINSTKDPAVYSPMMDKVANSAEDFVDSHNRSGWPLAGGVMWLGLAGVNVYGQVKRRREERESDEQQAAYEAHQARMRLEEEAYEARAADAGRSALERARSRAARTNTDARENDNDIWTNRDNDEDDGNQMRD